MVLSNAKTEIDLAFTRKELKGLSYENAFGGSTSFLRRRYTKNLKDVDIAITGVPFDQAVTNRPGARFGPRAIREASTLQTFDRPYGWDFDPMQELNIIDYGDLAFDYAKVQEFPSLLQQHISKILSNNIYAQSIFISCTDTNLNRCFRVYQSTFNCLVKHRPVVNSVFIIIRPSI